MYTICYDSLPNLAAGFPSGGVPCLMAFTNQDWAAIALLFANLLAFLMILLTLHLFFKVLG